MAYLKRVTNSNKDIEEKMNYFINRFQHMNENSGSELEFDLETPLSIIQKIQFLLENESDADFRTKYCDIYFLSPIIQDCYLWQDYPEFSQIKQIIDQYLKCGVHESKNEYKKRKQSLIETHEFRNDLEILLDRLKRGLPKTLHKYLISVLACKLPLREHDHPNQLSFLARMFVSGAYYSGKSTKEIHDIISRIFDESKDRFPFPEHARTKKLRQKLLKESVLNTQIAAFQELLHDNRTLGVVVTKLYGGAFPADFNLTYDNVQFLGQKHPNIERLRANTKEDVHGDFFSKTQEEQSVHIFICTKVTSFTHSSVNSTMRFLTSNAIKYLESILKRDFILDPTNNYIITNRAWKYKGGLWSSQKYETPFTEYDLHGLQDNPFKFLHSKRKVSAIEWFLSKEPLLVDARRSGTALDYWKYLESLFKYPGSTCKVERMLPDILLLNVGVCQKRRILRTLIHGFDMLNGGTGLLNVSYEKLSQVNRSLRKGLIPAAIKKYDSLFVQEIVKEHQSALDPTFLATTKKYYYRSIMEVYGLRNFQVHRGITNPYARIKTEHTIQFMITRFRWLVFAELNQNHTGTFEEVINILYQKSQNLSYGH